MSDAETALVAARFVIPGASAESCEDAPPLVEPLSGGTVLLAVADGLGGYPEGWGGRTGGYHASRVVRAALAEVLPRTDPWSMPPGVFGRAVTRLLRERLECAARERMGSSRLRGTLTQRLATTLAGALVAPAGARPGAVRTRLFWIGDSRLYLLDRESLRQLTIDDQKSPSDAFGALTNDSPMSQFLSASMEDTWRVHALDLELPREAFLIACTDGCFAYWKTPMQWEHALVEALAASDGPDAWAEEVKERVREVKGDDASMVAIPLGSTWEEARAAVLSVPTAERACCAPHAGAAEAARWWAERYRHLHDPYLAEVRARDREAAAQAPMQPPPHVEQRPHPSAPRRSEREGPPLPVDGPTPGSAEYAEVDAEDPADGEPRRAHLDPSPREVAAETAPCESASVVEGAESAPAAPVAPAADDAVTAPDQAAGSGEALPSPTDAADADAGASRSPAGAGEGAVPEPETSCVTLGGGLAPQVRVPAIVGPAQGSAEPQGGPDAEGVEPRSDAIVAVDAVPGTDQPTGEASSTDEVEPVPIATHRVDPAAVPTEASLAAEVEHAAEKEAPSLAAVEPSDAPAGKRSEATAPEGEAGLEERISPGPRPPPRDPPLTSLDGWGVKLMICAFALGIGWVLGFMTSAAVPGSPDGSAPRPKAGSAAAASALPAQNPPAATPAPSPRSRTDGESA